MKENIKAELSDYKVGQTKYFVETVYKESGKTLKEAFEHLLFIESANLNYKS